MNLIAELNTAGAACTKASYRDVLFGAATELMVLCKRFHIDQTTENLIALNGAWAHGVRVLKAASR